MLTAYKQPFSITCVTYTIAMCTVTNSWYGQRNCPKHVDFHSKNKFEKVVQLVGFIIRNLSRCTITWTSKSSKHMMKKHVQSKSVSCTRGTGISVSGVKRPVCGIEHPPLSSAIVWVELYLHLAPMPSWHVTGLPFILLLAKWIEQWKSCLLYFVPATVGTHSIINHLRPTDSCMYYMP